MIQVAAHSPTKCQNCSLFHSLHVQHKVAMLEDKVQSLITERDETMHELSRVQDEFDQNATALSTLQTVLEQFQKGTFKPQTLANGFL